MKYESVNEDLNDAIAELMPVAEKIGLTKKDIYAMFNDFKSKGYSDTQVMADSIRQAIKVIIDSAPDEASGGAGSGDQ